MASDDNDSQLMNMLVRMVVPMRREFGRQLDVGHFLHDFVYAREVLEEALRSQDSRLLEYARYVEKRFRGPREASASKPAGATPAAASPLPADAAARSEPAARAEPTADELRERVLKKYTSGLR